MFASFKKPRSRRDRASFKCRLSVGSIILVSIISTGTDAGTLALKNESTRDLLSNGRGPVKNDQSSLLSGTERCETLTAFETQRIAARGGDITCAVRDGVPGSALG